MRGVGELTRTCLLAFLCALTLPTLACSGPYAGPEPSQSDAGGWTSTTTRKIPTQCPSASGLGPSLYQ